MGLREDIKVGDIKGKNREMIKRIHGNKLREGVEPSNKERNDGREK